MDTRKNSAEKGSARDSAAYAGRIKQRKMDKKAIKWTWAYQLRRIIWPVLLIGLGFALPKLAATVPNFIERYYSRGAYPLIARALAAVSSIFPFSLAEILIYAALIVIAVLLIVRLYNMIFGRVLKRKKNVLRFFSFLISIGIFAGVMLNLFYLLWGFNHYRVTLADSLELKVCERPHSDLAQTYEALAIKAARLRELVDEDEFGFFALSSDDSMGFNAVRKAYLEMGEEYPIFSAYAYSAKAVFASEYMSKAGIAGIYIPYTAEMNLNINQPDLYLPADAAHETAHYYGFAREDEANFISYLAACYSDDVSLQYSGTMLALINCANQLYSVDSEEYYRIAEKYYTDGMKRDLSDYSKYLDAYKDEPAQKVQDTLNDAYLKYNEQEAGVESYGRMVDLVIAYFDKLGLLD